MLSNRFDRLRGMDGRLGKTWRVVKEHGLYGYNYLLLCEVAVEGFEIYIRYNDALKRFLYKGSTLTYLEIFGWLTKKYDKEIEESWDEIKFILIRRGRSEVNLKCKNKEIVRELIRYAGADIQFFGVREKDFISVSIGNCEKICNEMLRGRRYGIFYEDGRIVRW